MDLQDVANFALNQTGLPRHNVQATKGGCLCLKDRFHLKAQRS